jgi:hypothetical protein
MINTTVASAARVQAIDKPIQAPGQCCLCGSAGDSKRKFIDFGKQLDWYGAVYFCTICIAEVALASGFLPVAEFDKLHDTYRELLIKHKKLESEYKTVDNALRSVFGGDYSVSPSPDESFNSLLETVENTKRSESESTEGNSETDEPTDVEGSDDLFDATDFDNDGE